MAAIFKSSLQNLSPLPSSLKVEPLAKPKTSLKFFMNTTKPKTKILAVFGQKPGPIFTKGLRLSQVLGLNPVLKLRLLSQLSFVLKPYSQRVT